MPIYEYECLACGAVYSELMPFDAEGAPTCPHCGGDTSRKRLSRFAVGRSDAARGTALAEQSASVDRGNRREMARFLQQAGGGLTDDAAMREVVDRAAAGATDADMGDIVRDVPVRDRQKALAGHHAVHHDQPAGDTGGGHVHGPGCDH
ncbi:MAG: hypothetical protein KKA73_29465 [Chloroflexi bacterium]|nr:hypothetical protein [Chloroflexota bacterium]MBU1751826.1 hypothetical protein [Chloroflexota bacterium]MBU1877887.1 hypothetical protein [Chloroflexota bacterium]